MILVKFERALSPKEIKWRPESIPGTQNDISGAVNGLRMPGGDFKMSERALGGPKEIFGTTESAATTNVSCLIKKEMHFAKSDTGFRFWAL